MLWHLGWPPPGASTAEAQAAYVEALQHAKRVVHTILGYASPDLAGDALQQANLGARAHFATRTDPLDIVNPRAYARRMIRNEAMSLLRVQLRESPYDPGDHIEIDVESAPDLGELPMPLAPFVRFGVSIRLFNGMISPLTAATILALVGAGSG